MDEDNGSSSAGSSNDHLNQMAEDKPAWIPWSDHRVQDTLNRLIEEWGNPPVRSDEVMRALYLILEAATQGSFHDVTGHRSTWFCTSNQCCVLRWESNKAIDALEINGRGHPIGISSAVRTYFGGIFRC